MLIWRIKIKNLKTGICNKERRKFNRIHLLSHEVKLFHLWLEAIMPKTKIQMLLLQANRIHMHQPWSMIFFRVKMNGKIFRTSSSSLLKPYAIPSSLKVQQFEILKTTCIIKPPFKSFNQV